MRAIDNKKKTMNMKKYIWMSVVALAMASCSQNDEPALSGEGLETTHVVFTANVESGMKTRAVTDPADATPTRALLEIYDASGNLVGEQISGVSNSEGTAFTFSADLHGLQTYTCAFWADTDGKYNTTSLKSISYSDINDEQQGIAFSAKCELNPAENKNVSVTLTHAVAKLVLHETGTGLKANDVVGATFTRPNYTFDASSQTYTEDATTSGTAIDLPYTVVSDGETGDLTAAYMLVPASVVVDNVNLYFGTTEEYSKAITNVPLKTNHRTLLRGAFEDLFIPAPSQTFSVTCDTNWEGDSEKTLTTVVNPETHAIVLSEAGKLTADLIGQAVADGTNITLTLSGPMNDADAQALYDYFYGETSPKDTHVSTLDMSGVTGLATINDETFRNATSLKKVILPTSVTNISESAFVGSGLETFTANHVTNVGGGAFGYCLNLTELSLPSVTTFGNGEFILAGCTSLTTLKLTSANFDGSFPPNFFSNTSTENVELYVHQKLKSNKSTVYSTTDGSITGYLFRNNYNSEDIEFKSITLVDDSGNPVDESTL